MSNNIALLVMDYQNGILGNVSNAEALLKNARKAIDTARRYGATIGYVRVAFDETDIQALPERNKMAAFVAQHRDRVRNGSQATAIHDTVAPLPGDIVVRKTRVGPFTTTDLEQQLRARDVDTLVLAGVSTSGVVLSTVREAADRDYKLFVLSDACGDSAPDAHDCLIEKVFPRQADVITVEELEARVFG